MDSKTLVCKLLHRAFLDVRIEAAEIQSDRIFAIADLFHVVPLQMERAEHGELSYDEILKGLQNKSYQKNVLAWLENAIKDAFQDK